MSRRQRSGLLSAAAALGAFAVVVALGIPLVTGAGWAEVGDRLGALGWPAVLGLAVLWLSGLWVYTFVLTASLPGLSHGRAFVLNTAGSAVSNVVPFGGAAGVGVTALLSRRWGLPTEAVAASVVVTGVWNAVAGMALPAVGLTVLALDGSGAWHPVELTAALVLWAGSAALVVTVRSERFGAGIASSAGRLARLLPPAWRPEPGGPERAVIGLRRACREVAGAHWIRLTAGMTGYVMLQAILFGCCLAAVGSPTGVAATMSAFLTGRVLSLLVVTPGGSGITETGTLAVLMAHHADPVTAAAGVLLFSTFVVVLEIPLGALTWTVSFGRAFLSRSGRPATGAAR